MGLLTKFFGKERVYGDYTEYYWKPAGHVCSKTIYFERDLSYLKQRVQDERIIGKNSSPIFKRVWKPVDGVRRYFALNGLSNIHLIDSEQIRPFGTFEDAAKYAEVLARDENRNYSGHWGVVAIDVTDEVMKS